MTKEIDHRHTKEMICPYCGTKQSDVWEIVGHKEDGEAWCGSCSVKFRWSVHTTTTYTTSK